MGRRVGLYGEVFYFLVAVWDLPKWGGKACLWLFLSRHYLAIASELLVLFAIIVESMDCCSTCILGS